MIISGTLDHRYPGCLEKKSMLHICCGHCVAFIIITDLPKHDQDLHLPIFLQSRHSHHQSHHDNHDYILKTQSRSTFLIFHQRRHSWSQRQRQCRQCLGCIIGLRKSDRITTCYFFKRKNKNKNSAVNVWAASKD